MVNIVIKYKWKIMKQLSRFICQFLIIICFIYVYGTEYPGPNINVPSSNPGITVGQLEITDTGTILDIDVKINFDSSVGNGLEWLIVVLRSPNGSSVELCRGDNNSGTLDGASMYETIFDDEASVSISDAMPPYIGSFQPIGDLSSIDGESIQGTWELIIYNSSNYSGTANWSIYLETNGNIPIEPPYYGTEYPGPNINVPSSNPGITVGQLEITDTGTILDIDVKINFDSSVGNGLEWLIVVLRSPNGSSVELCRGDNNSGTLDGASMYETIFDDEASVSISDAASPYIGSFKPIGFLNIVNGESIQGTWELVVQNTSNYSGNVKWSIFIESSKGLIAYYPFNGNANDESGNGNNGTVSGVTLTTDRFGNQNSAYSFDGVDDYIEVNHEERLDIQKFTVAAWVRYNLGSMNKAGVFNNGYTVDHYALCADSSGITIWTNWPASNNVGVMYLSHVLTDENFHFLTATYDGQNRVIWIDGKKVLEDNFTEVIDYSASEKCYIGANFPGSDEFFKGDIDDIRIYNNVLEEYKIQQLFEEGGWGTPSSPKNLIATPFDRQIILTWTPNTVSDLKEYRIYRDTSLTVSTLIDSVVGTPPDTVYVDDGLTNGQTYYYRITAVDTAYNESDFSNEVYAIPGDYISPEIQILNPVEGFSIPEYEPLTVTWTATDNIAMDSVLIIYTNEPGVDLQFMGKVPADSSQFTFDVPAGITDQAMIYLHGWDTSGNDTLVHSPYFSVTDNTPPDSVVIADLDTCAIGDGVKIEWISGDNSRSFRMHYIFLSNNDEPFTLIDSVAGAVFSCIWIVPNIVSDSCRIKVKSFDPVGLSAADTSEYFSIVDNIRPEVEVLTPQEGFSIPEHEDITVTWVATDNIQLYCIVVSYSKDGGYSGRTMGIVSPDTNYFRFQIPSGVTDSATIRVKAKDIYFNTGAEFSPLFSVTDNTPPEVDLLSMFSDSSFEIMSTRSIFWNASDNVAIKSIDIVYSTDAGDTWISISENESNDGEYSWLIPDTPSDQCKIKVTATDSVGLSDEAISAGLFTIYVTYPKLISHSTIISPLDTIQLGFSQTLNTEQFSTGLFLSSAIEEDLTCDLQFLNNDQDVSIYPENSFISGDTISLILSADQITNAYGYGLDGNQNDAFEGSPLDDDTVTVYVNYSGDFDGNDQVDFNDLTLFANGWYSKDYKYELGPVSGDIPHFITMTDSLFNIEDAMTFGRMWNWFVGLGKHVITMPQLSFGGGFTTEQKGNDLIIYSRASAGKRIVLQYDLEIITINKKQQSLSKPTDLTFEFYADCIDSNRSEYVHYSFNEELSNVPVIFTIESKQRNPVNIIIGIEGINETGELILSDVITTRFQPIPDKFEVFPNYPNPFNSQTVIEYAIPVQSDVLINIYDLLGRKVKTLTNNRHEAKYYTIVWDGKDEQGRLAASGLYFLRIVARTESKTFIKTKKMVMIR